MSDYTYQFGQFRRTQRAEDKFLSPIEVTLLPIITNSMIYENLNFIDFCIPTQLPPLINNIQRSYYLRFRVKKQKTLQVIFIKLVNKWYDGEGGYNDSKLIASNRQKLATVTVPIQSKEDDWLTYELIISPNAIYDKILFELNRDSNDYNMEIRNEEGIGPVTGRTVELEIDRLDYIENIITTDLNPKIQNKGILKQIGVQSAPGLLMCINGEGIRVGKSGLYELKNGLTVDSIGFIVEPNDNQYFLLDYQF